MSPSDTPRVLVISREEWVASSFQSILEGAGYGVLRATTGEEALELASRGEAADLVMSDLRVPDMEPAELCDALRASPLIRSSTPLLVFTDRVVGRRERIRYTRLGAWAVLSPPFDPEEVLDRAAVYVAAKRETDRSLEGGHLDLLTGLYNRRGLLRRVDEVVATAARSGLSFACVVVGPERAVPSETWRSAARVLTKTTRLSDVLGRTTGDELVIIAPGTGAEGGRRLAERVFEALESEGATPGEPSAEPVRLRAGVYAVPRGEPRKKGPTPERVLSEAVTAFRRAKAKGEGERVHAVEGRVE